MLAQIIVSTALVLLLPVNSLAYTETKQTTTTKQIELDNLREQIETTTKDLRRDKKALDAHIKQLAKVETQLSNINRDIHQRTQSMQQVQQSLNKLNHHRHQLNQKLGYQQQQLAEQVKAAYMQGTQPAVKMLLNIQNAEYLSRVMTYYDYIHKTQLQVISAAKQTLAELDSNQTQINQQQKTLSKTQNELMKQQKVLTAKQSDRQQMIDKIKEKLKSKSLALEKLRDDERQLETVIAKQQYRQKIPAPLDSKALSKLKGQLNWPISGEVMHHFGERIQNKLNWKGIVIKGQPGMSVITPAAGRVAFADWMRGFGLLMIVDHGHGFLTLYGRNQVLYKQPGDDVAPGEVIGLVGTSGGFSESGLYFEIRHHGLPVDPEKWLSKEA